MGRVAPVVFEEEEVTFEDDVVALGVVALLVVAVVGGGRLPEARGLVELGEIVPCSPVAVAFCCRCC